MSNTTQRFRFYQGRKGHRTGHILNNWKTNKRNEENPYGLKRIPKEALTLLEYVSKKGRREGQGRGRRTRRRARRTRKASGRGRRRTRRTRRTRKTRRRGRRTTRRTRKARRRTRTSMRESGRIMTERSEG